MTPEHRKFRASDAKALLDNEIFKSAFKSMGEYLEAKALSCDTDNKDITQRVVIAKQILAGVKREIERLVEDGIVADIQLAEIEQRKRMFRFVR